MAATTYRAPVPKLKSGGQGRKDIKVISAEQVDQLCAAAVKLAEPIGTDLSTPIRFSAYTGIRLGEMLALEDVHGSLPGRLDIAYQLTKSGKRKKLPKGEHERTIIVPPEAGDRYGSNTFTLELTGGIHVDGAMCELSRSSHWRAWDRIRMECGIPLDWHELRHFSATWWLAKGAAPEDVAIQLGHRDGGQLVRELYGHIEEDALARLEALATMTRED